MDKPEDVADLIKESEKTSHKKECNYICSLSSRKVFSRFQEKEKFVRLVADFGVHKSNLIFKINLFKLLDKYPKLMKSSFTLSFSKNYFRDIKQICKESKEFE